MICRCLMPCAQLAATRKHAASANSAAAGCACAQLLLCWGCSDRRLRLLPAEAQCRNSAARTSVHQSGAVRGCCRPQTGSGADEGHCKAFCCSDTCGTARSGQGSGRAWHRDSAQLTCSAA